MFTTLRLNKDTQNVEIAPRSAQKACTNCRAKKLRCPGGRSCERCRVKNIPCVYPRSLPRKGRTQLEAASNDSGNTPHHANAPLTTTPGLGDIDVDFSVILENLNHQGVALPACGSNSNGLSDSEHHDLFISQIIRSGDSPMEIEQRDITASSPGLNHDSDSSSTVGSEKDGTGPREADDSEDSVALDLGDIENVDTTVAEAGITCLSPYRLQLSHDGFSPSAYQAYDAVMFDPGCQCLSLASRLLEGLSIEESKACCESATRLLHLQKITLNQCFSFLGCFSCCSLSHFVFILIVICQKMASCFSRIYDMLLDQYLRLQGQLNLMDEHLRDASSEVVALQQVSVKYYELDGHEAPCVIGVLTVLQIRKLKEFLSRLRRLARGSNWDSHVVVMAGIEGEIKRQLRLYNRNCDTMFPLEEED
ncbi:hypothetical protein K491DRAFT_758761 [Lophiostoma macrostomum CBS 122681]|uniref:Zn(2)-C6 fungal-type domain-containing protein n=1 Tax=Lophiostoma macrostomum CBS 122681 TaxID=1314788 RepID=A0A6A6T4Q4_9PLEO|nr:hypothetical protein K491DRAFT_758761 [Lophiostoma macrostomum CBS 122681]